MVRHGVIGRCCPSCRRARPARTAPPLCPTHMHMLTHPVPPTPPPEHTAPHCPAHLLQRGVLPGGFVVLVNQLGADALPEVAPPRAKVLDQAVVVGQALGQAPPGRPGPLQVLQADSGRQRRAPADGWRELSRVGVSRKGRGVKREINKVQQLPGLSPPPPSWVAPAAHTSRAHAPLGSRHRRRRHPPGELCTGAPAELGVPRVLGQGSRHLHHARLRMGPQAVSAWGGRGGMAACMQEVH